RRVRCSDGMDASRPLRHRCAKLKFRHTTVEQEASMTASMTIAVDLAKTVFEIAVADADWRIVERYRLSRSQFQKFFFNRAQSTVVMEACGTAHFWGRWLQAHGFTVRLIPAHYARAYRRRNK